MSLELKETVRLSPDRMLRRLWLAAAFSLAGKTKEARAEIAEIRRLNPDFSLEDCLHNSYNAYQPEDKQRFMDAPKKAGLS